MSAVRPFFWHERTDASCRRLESQEKQLSAARGLLRITPVLLRPAAFVQLRT